MPRRSKIEIVGIYDGRSKWAIARFPLTEEEKSPKGPYRIGTFVKGGITFCERPFNNREDAEAWLLYSLDPDARL